MLCPLILTPLFALACTMADKIVYKIAAIEAEADCIIEQARARAEELEASVAAAIEALREERQRRFEEGTEAYRQQKEAEAAKEGRELDQKAEQAAAGLDALDEAAVGEATDLILKRLHGG